MLPITVHLATDSIELERVDALLRPPQERKAQKSSMILNGFVAVIYLGLGLLRLLIGGRGSSNGYFWLGLGLLNLIIIAITYRTTRAPKPLRTKRADRKLASSVAAVSDSDVTISDAGLTFLPSARVLPWSKVAEVRNVGGYFTFVTQSRYALAAIRKSDLANDGRDLWKALDDRFVSKRYLVRSSLSFERIAVRP